MAKIIAVIGALDTKGDEFLFFKKEIEKRGHAALEKMPNGFIIPGALNACAILITSYMPEKGLEKACRPRSTHVTKIFLIPVDIFCQMIFTI